MTVFEPVPMGAFPNRGNPREVRSAMEATYASYISGEILYPWLKPVSPPEAFSRKTVAIATALHREWQQIATDNKVLTDVTKRVTDRVVDPDSPDRSSIILKTVGRNALMCVEVSQWDGTEEPAVVGDVRLAFEELGSSAERLVMIDEEGLSIVISHGWRDEFQPPIEDFGVRLKDGRIHGYAAPTHFVIRDLEGKNILAVQTELDPDSKLAQQLERLKQPSTVA